MTSSTDDSGGHSSADRSSSTVCYRCDESIPADRVLRVSTRPCPALESRYAAVARACCPDCAAGIGLLALTGEVARAGSSMGSD
ncbi:hypothetical protein [Halostagnicola kamekurae]|uniref:hypothetical protein n=1 Tax=Halostagnicola kamekurae TaxID=619731 RepID=UPI00111438C4|nr:hypothetical protein [Halostagnicola kamekurae]